jgi:ATP-dependent Clp protease ATP-binding subunit ClpB
MDEIYVSPEVDLILNQSEQLAKRMKDEFISVEHLFLAILQKPGTAWEIYCANIRLKKVNF